MNDHAVGGVGADDGELRAAERLDHVGVARRELGLDVLGVGVLEPEVVRVRAVHRQAELPARRPGTFWSLRYSPLASPALLFAMMREDLVVLHQLLRRGHVASGVAAVVDVAPG